MAIDAASRHRVDVPETIEAARVLFVDAVSLINGRLRWPLCLLGFWPLGNPVCAAGAVN